MFSKIMQWCNPYICCLCHQESDRTRDLCHLCESLLPYIEDRCYRCGARLEESQDPIYCNICIEKPPYYDRLCALFDYIPPVRHLVTGLKFGGHLAFGRVLGELLRDKVSVWYERDLYPEAIIPVPLHASRLRKRGFNQSVELILPIKREKQIPVLLNSCQRIRATKPQAHLNAEMRKKNVEDAFYIHKNIKYSHVAIIDDVVTTGSTVNALSKTLKTRGVERVDVFCICHG